MSSQSERGDRAPPPRYIWERSSSDTSFPSEVRVKEEDEYMNEDSTRRRLTISTSFLDSRGYSSSERFASTSQGPSPIYYGDERSPLSRSPSIDELRDDSPGPPPPSSYPTSPVDAPSSMSPVVMSLGSRTFSSTAANGAFSHTRLPPLQLPPLHSSPSSELNPQLPSMSPRSRVAKPPYPSPSARRDHDPPSAQSPQTPYYEASSALVYGHPNGNPAFGSMSPLPPIKEIKRDTVTTSATQAASANRRRNEAHFLCPVPGCGSTFTRRFNLRGHMRSHLEERPFVCEWPDCNKSFARQHDCKRHTALHTMKPKNNACRGCNKSFSRLDALNRHLRSEGGAECRLMLGQTLPSLSAAVSSGSSDLSEIMNSPESPSAIQLPSIRVSTSAQRPRVKTEPLPDDEHYTLAPLLSPHKDSDDPMSASSESAKSNMTLSPVTSHSSALTDSPTSPHPHHRK